MTNPLVGNDPVGARPLTHEEFEGLRLSFVTTRDELNIAEQSNIEDAVLWAFGSRHVAPVDRLLTVGFSNRVHREMFGRVWSWAGKHRTRVTNIGVEPNQVVTQTKLLFDDALYWHQHAAYEASETAVRLHHRLVSVHPYANGNGRHARLMADIYLHINNQPPLTWGTADGTSVDEVLRRRYIKALQSADAGDMSPLLTLARS